MGSVEITPVNGDASNSVDGNMSALETSVELIGVIVIPCRDKSSKG